MRLALLFSLLAGSAVAQAPEGWARLHVGDGLAHNSVYAIHQDREGFLWFGTLDGLDRYDGYAFVTHRHDPSDPSSLPHNLVRSLHEDADGTLWVGTQNGVARRRPRAPGFERFAVPADPATGDRSVFEIVRDEFNIDAGRCGRPRPAGCSASTRPRAGSSARSTASRTGWRSAPTRSGCWAATRPSSRGRSSGWTCAAAA